VGDELFGHERGAFTVRGNVRVVAAKHQAAADFLNSGLQHKTSCLIADIRMLGMSGLDLQAKVKRGSLSDTDHFHNRARRRNNPLAGDEGGAVKFLAKPFDGATLIGGVRAALRGED
jgi:FixJ family two-component response regulator